MRHSVFVKSFAVAFVLVLLVISVVYECVSPVYSIENHTVMIRGEKYVFTQTNWQCEQTGKRIGYIEGQPVFGKILYLFVPHGLYRIADDDRGIFYQIQRAGGSKNYALLVREDIPLDPPVEKEVTAVVCQDVKITDPATIRELFQLLNGTGDETPTGSLNTGELKIFSAQYPGICYAVNWYRDEEHQYFIVPFDAAHGQYVRVPDEFAKNIWS